MVKQTIQIFCRVKPTKAKSAIYSVEDDESLAKSNIEFVIPRDLADGFINNKRETYSFTFQKVFDQQVKQDDIFDHVAQGVVDNVLSGYNGTIFAYGQTGSGKTFTITGGVEKYGDRGIIPRTLSYIYSKYEEDKDHIHTTEISYLEIYNENGYDLLDPKHEAAKLEDLPKVALMEDSDQNIHLKNLSVLPAQNEEEALNLLFLGDTNRMIAETPMNQASTRSHCIFTIHVTSREPGSATIRRAKLHLVDLAGSERVTKSQVGGQLLAEAKYINLSLHFLEQVIVALSEKKRQHIPYRNSMMTSVLRDSLGGNCMTTMIATVAVDRKNLDESISTCRFAQRVAMIKNEATLNEELDPKLMIIKLKKEVQTLKDDLAMVTGEQRSDDLTQEEIERLNDLLEMYLKDDDLEATLEVGGDMRKIQYSYRFLKKRILDVAEKAVDDGGERENRSEPGREPNVQLSLSPEEIQRLREILQQRDNEISILVSMLKKERKRVLEAESRAGNADASVASPTSATPVVTSGKTYVKSDYAGGDDDVPQEHSRVKDAQLSEARQEAFKIFQRDHPEMGHVTDQKQLLKRRFVEAKSLGQELNNSRNEINTLKTSLDRLRRQMAVQSAVNGDDSFEEREREQDILHKMEEAKAKYKSAFTRLKAMKAEIEHLQHLLDKARVQMQHEFETWWQSQSSNRTLGARSRPASSLSSHRGPRQRATGNYQAWATPPLSPDRRGQLVPESGRKSKRSISPPGPISPRESSLSHGRNALVDLRRSDVNETAPAPTRNRPEVAARFARPPSAPRSRHSGSITPSSGGLNSGKIPLTGDKETDADIMAFVKARESLMKRQQKT